MKINNREEFDRQNVFGLGQENRHLHGILSAIPI